MADRKTGGAGLHIGGVLGRATQPKGSPAEPVEEPEPLDPIAEPAESEPTSPAKGRGRRAPAAKPKGRVKARTVYLDDDLFERILVQAHRRDKTISEYVAMIL